MDDCHEVEEAENYAFTKHTLDVFEWLHKNHHEGEGAFDLMITSMIECLKRKLQGIR